MDGNRRYAKKLGLPSFMGHKYGYDKVFEVCEWTRECKIENIILYAFSTENWKREEKEVKGLLILLRKIIDDKKLKNLKSRIKIIGDTERFPTDIQKGLEKLEKETEIFKDSNIYIALSYGGRLEITEAVNKLFEKLVKNTNLNMDVNTEKDSNIKIDKLSKITESDIEQNMWAGSLSPDAIIRTGGEKRLSNFLLWQSAYSELFFIDTLWPDFKKEEFINILEEFKNRKRNFGK